MNSEVKQRKMWLPSKEKLDFLAKNENLEPEVLLGKIQDGSISVLMSAASENVEDFRPVVIGNGTRKKVCVAIGMDGNSIRHFNKDELNVILNAEPDVVCDVSVGAGIPEALSEIRNYINVPLGSCPTYDIFNGKIKDILSKEYILDRIEAHLKTGVDYILLHFGVESDMLELISKSERVIPLTSRGGGAIVRYMKVTKSENPLLLYFDDICELCKKYKVVLDLGDIFRTGCVEDGENIINDELKIRELKLLSDLRSRALSNGLQIVCEGGGHVPLSKIPEFITWQKEQLNQAPMFFNGPLPTDRAVGFDSVNSAIGISVASQYGGDMFLALSDSEHYGKPTPLQSAQAIRYSRVAMSASEFSLKEVNEVGKNVSMGKARASFNWEKQIENSLYPKISTSLFMQENLIGKRKPCSLCGDLCPLLVKN